MDPIVDHVEAMRGALMRAICECVDAKVVHGQLFNLFDETRETSNAVLAH